MDGNATLAAVEARNVDGRHQGGDEGRRAPSPKSRSGSRDRMVSRERDSRRRSSSRDRPQRRDGRDRREDDRRRSRSREYDNRRSSSRYDRDNRSSSRYDGERRSSGRYDGGTREGSPARSKPSSVMDLLNKVIGGGSLATAVASTMLPSGPMGMMGAGMAPMADVTGALAKIQALSGNVPSGNEKAMRELYVGGLPQGVGLNANQIRDFFNLVMTQSGLIRAPGQPVIQARIHETGAFAFVQFRSQEETDLALSLNGIPFMGSPLKIGRPKGYQTAAATPVMNPAFSSVTSGAMSVHLPSVAGALGLASSMAETPSDVILVANISSALTVDSLKEIMGPFGVLSDCIVLPCDAGAATQRALVRYEDAGLTDVVIKGLNNLPIGDLAMSLSRAPLSLVAHHLPRAVAVHAAAPSVASAPQLTDVLELTNVVVGGELQNPSDITDLQEDVAEECGKYGRVLEVLVPLAALSAPAGQERVPLYVHLASVTDAEKCAAALRGRKFDGRLVGIRFVTVDVLQASKSAPSIPPGGNIEDEEDMGLEGGSGNHFSSVAIPPPSSYAGSGNTRSGAPEDGLALPSVPAAADVD